MHFQIVNLFLILPSSYHSFNFAIAKVAALNIFDTFYVPVLYIGLLLIFFIALSIIFAFPTIAIAIDVVLFHVLKGDSEE